MTQQLLYFPLQVHHLDLTSRLPWLKDKQKKFKKEGEEEGEIAAVTAGEEEDEQKEAEIVASELLGTGGENSSGAISEHPLHKATPTDHPASDSLGDILFQYNDGTEPSLPPLPPKDYDLSPADQLSFDLPPRDYPMSADHVKPLEQTGDLISDADYYAQMMNNFNS